MVTGIKRRSLSRKLMVGEGWLTMAISSNGIGMRECYERSEHRCTLLHVAIGVWLRQVLYYDMITRTAMRVPVGTQNNHGSPGGGDGRTERDPAFENPDK